MTEATLAVERDHSVATIWLNRPQLHNAFDEELIAALTAALIELDADASVRVVILGGRGGSYCAGGDLNWMRRMAGFTEAENLQDASRLADMLRVLDSLSKPTIARVHGAAIAGGTGLVAACDIAIGTTQASFGTTEVRIGLIPATIGPYVIAAIGARAARRYFLTGERIAAQQALQLGLLHEIVADDSLDARISEISRALIAGAPAAQSACKRLVADLNHQPISAALIADTSQRIATARSTAEARIGIDAFFARRQPNWER